MKFLTRSIVAVMSTLALVTFARADVIPPGSYQRTCGDFHTTGTTLTATCRRRFGGTNFTTLRNYHLCRGDIANVDGRLTCVAGDEQPTPDGSYRESCRNAYVEGDTLFAQCLDRFSRWHSAALPNYRACSGDIFNANGVLRCRYGDDEDGLPGGNWRFSCRSAHMEGTVLFALCRDSNGYWHDASIDLRDCELRAVSSSEGRLLCSESYSRITLYVRRNYLGGARIFTGDVPNLNVYGMGNLVSSVIVQGGFWQLCDRPNYRGDCILISRSQPNLYPQNFNDRAESLRRVR